MNLPTLFLPLLATAFCHGQVPEITDFAPSSGRPGDIILFEGQDFDRTATNNAVFFGRVKARVTSASVTDLRVEVPRGVQAGEISVTVGGLTAFSRIPFQPTFPPFGRETNACYAFRLAIVATNSLISTFASADLDGDGAAELILSSADRQIHIYRSEPGSHFITINSFRKVATLGLEISPNFLVPMDYDSDGRIDLVAVSTQGGFTFFRNIHLAGELSERSFASASRETRTFSPTAVQVADLDRDGQLDLAMAEGSSMGLYKNIYRAGVTNQAVFAPPIYITLPGLSRVLAVGDLNRDGHVELVVAYGRVAIYSHHDRAGVLTRDSFARTILPVPAGVAANYTSVALGDIEGDGFPDIVVNQGTQSAVFWNQTEGEHITTNHFPRVQLSALGTPFNGLFDVNGDARPDLLSGGINYQANSAGDSGVITSDTFSTRLSYSANQQIPQFSADLNADGSPDFLLAPRGNTLYILENVCQSAPAFGEVLLINNMVRIQGFGFPGQTLPLETSGELRVWQRGTSIRFDSSGAGFYTIPPANRRFFRFPPGTNSPPRVALEAPPPE